MVARQPVASAHCGVLAFWDVPEIALRLADVARGCRGRVRYGCGARLPIRPVSLSGGDYVHAFHDWLGLAEQGDPAAEAGIGFLFHKGLGVAQEDVEAAPRIALARTISSAGPVRQDKKPVSLHVTLVCEHAVLRKATAIE